MNTYRKGCLFIIADLGWYLSCWKENKTNKKFKQRNDWFKFQRRIEVKVRHTNETCICRLEGSSWLGGVEISSSSAEKSHYHLNSLVIFCKDPVALSRKLTGGSHSTYGCSARVVESKYYFVMKLETKRELYTVICCLSYYCSL